MFEWIGKQAISGALKNIPSEFSAVISKIPIARLFPYLYNYWDSLSEEEKAKDAAIMYKAALKAMAMFAGA